MEVIKWGGESQSLGGGKGREGDGTLAPNLKTTGVLEIATRDFQIYVLEPYVLLLCLDIFS